MTLLNDDNNKEYPMRMESGCSTRSPSSSSHSTMMIDNPVLPLLSNDIVEEILNAPAPYVNEEQKTMCKRMVEELSIEDQEIAACTSYAYWVASTTSSLPPPSDEIRIRMAMRDARRFWVGEKGNFRHAMKAFRFAIDYRKEHHIDLLRTCFPAHATSESPNDKEENMEEAPTCQEEEEEDDNDRKKEEENKNKKEEQRLRALYRSYILDEVSKQVTLVRGQDVASRAIIMKMPRLAPPSTSKGEAFAITQLYMTERCIATTEYLSRGREEKMITLFNFGSYQSSNSPTVSCSQHCVTIGQKLYPERVQAILVIDAPFWMRAVFKILRPFLSKETQEKIHMLQSKNNKEKIIRKYIDKEYAMPFMMSDGKLTSPIDMNQYLDSVQYHCPYDEVYCTTTTMTTPSSTTTNDTTITPASITA